MLGHAGQAVPVAVQAAEERFRKHALKLHCIQRSLVFSLCLEGVFHRTIKSISVRLKIVKNERESHL